MISCKGLNAQSSSTVPPFVAGKNIYPEDSSIDLTGMGNLNTVIVKVSTPTGAVNTATLRVTSCLELQPNTDSALYQFAMPSPPPDPVAMNIYNIIKSKGPAAVPSKLNANAWTRLWPKIKKLLALMKYAPGPLGVAANGVGMLHEALNSLTL